jgi:hypothetical protein
MEHTSVKITLLRSHRGAPVRTILMSLLVYSVAFVLLVFYYKLQSAIMPFNLFRYCACFTPLLFCLLYLLQIYEISWPQIVFHKLFRFLAFNNLEFVSLFNLTIFRNPFLPISYLKMQRLKHKNDHLRQCFVWM